MARGDIWTTMSGNIAAGGSFDRQPASGVEELAMDLGAQNLEGTAPNNVPAAIIIKIDGTNNDGYMMNGDGGAQAATWFAGAGKMVADNTNYFRVVNQGSSSGDLSFSTIVIG